MPGPGKNIYIDLSLPPRIVGVTLEVLSPLQARDGVLNIDTAPHSPLPEIPQLDRSLLTPGTIRMLLKSYERCIQPRYDILNPEILNHDGINLKKLSDLRRFQTLMACAIAAAREAYRTPSWKPFAHTCREWANDLITPIVSAADSDSITSILLLLVYELADPTRGIVWELLDIATRRYLQLGWHRTAPPQLGDAGIQRADVWNPEQTRLVSTLRDIEGRPNMSSVYKLTTNSDTDILSLIYDQLFHSIYGTSRIFDTHACPFVGEMSELMGWVDVHQSKEPVCGETWLLIFPICVRHRQCVSCFQEADERHGKGMKSLRRKVVSAAADLLSSTHRATI
ncbi:hypothetical protein BO71DRAFT_355460, partial [Aspergillus ellipticus CBS 707.79]